MKASKTNRKRLLKVAGFHSTNILPPPTTGTLKRSKTGGANWPRSLRKCGRDQTEGRLTLLLVPLPPKQKKLQKNPRRFAERGFLLGVGNSRFGSGGLSWAERVKTRKYASENGR